MRVLTKVFNIGRSARTSVSTVKPYTFPPHPVGERFFEHMHVQSYVFAKYSHCDLHNACFDRAFQQRTICRNPKSNRQAGQECFSCISVALSGSPHRRSCLQTDPTFSQCRLDRPPNGSPDGRMYLVNHVLDKQVPLTDILIPDHEADFTTNAATGNGSIGAQVELCERIYGRVPNVVLVDMFDRGDVFTAQDALNGV